MPGVRIMRVLGVLVLLMRIPRRGPFLRGLRVMSGVLVLGRRMCLAIVAMSVSLRVMMLARDCVRGLVRARHGVRRRRTDLQR